MNPPARLEDIEADIAEAERLMTGLRLTVAIKESIGEDTAADNRRILQMMQGWMLLQDPRRRIFEGDLVDASESKASIAPPLSQPVLAAQLVAR